MTQHDYNGMRQKLVALRDELEEVAKTGEQGAAVVELDQTKVGRLSRMDAMQAQAMAKASEERRSAMLRKIAAALRRLDDGAYGYCQACDEVINTKRLEFDPTTTLCIDCATRQESQ